MNEHMHMLFAEWLEYMLLECWQRDNWCNTSGQAHNKDGKRRAYRKDSIVDTVDCAGARANDPK